MSVAKAGRHCTCATHDQFGRVMVIRGRQERLARKQLCEWPGDSGGQSALLPKEGYGLLEKKGKRRGTNSAFYHREQILILKL